MKTYLSLVLLLIAIGASAQVKEVTATVPLSGQNVLDLSFDFADEINFVTWDKDEVLVEVKVNINDGEDNDIFSMETRKTASTVYVEMDKEMWKKIEKERKDKWNNCSFTSSIDYTVYLPASMEVKSKTISGDYTFEYFGSSMKLKTISGTIDMTVPSTKGLDFNAKTISGEIYSNLEIEYPFGKSGLKQIVGQDIRARISGGGENSSFETISGNIYLRKG